MKRLGILTALIPEAACLVRKPVTDQIIHTPDGIILYVCGMGMKGAGQGIDRLLENGADALMSVGTAGALDRSLNPGDVLIPEHIIHSDSPRIALDTRWRASATGILTKKAIPVHGGELLHVDEVIRSTEEKRDLHTQTGAAAADMESYIVADAANRQGIPALVVRVIVDSAATKIPDAVLSNSDAYGRPRIMGLANSLFFRPRQIIPLWRLARCFRTAAGRLQQLGRELPRLGPPE